MVARYSTIALLYSVLPKPDTPFDESILDRPGQPPHTLCPG